MKPDDGLPMSTVAYHLGLVSLALGLYVVFSRVHRPSVVKHVFANYYLLDYN